MESAVINIKVQPELKKQAQKVAKEMGLSLSTLVKGFLKQVIRTKSVTFHAEEELSDYAIQMLKESAEDVKKGKVKSFYNTTDAISYLDSIIKDDERKIRKSKR